MNKLSENAVLLLVLLGLPVVSFAANPYHISIFKNPNPALNFTVFVNKLSVIVNSVIPFLIGLAFFIIFWGIFKYIRSAGDSEKVAEGRRVVIWGVIALFLMLSFWGFVIIIKTSLFG